jgi:hypothetical protein
MTIATWMWQHTTPIQLCILAGQHPIRKSESLLYGPVWTDSPPDAQSSSCTVILSILATHSLNGAVLYKHLPGFTKPKAQTGQLRCHTMNKLMYMTQTKVA